MRISQCDVFINSPGRNYVTVRLTTGDGLIGLADATLNGREKAVEAYLTDHLLPCVHFNLAITNFGIQEFMGYPAETEAVFPHTYKYQDGALRLDETTPGLGIDYRHDLAEKHPYQPACLPVNRLTDGTMHDWLHAAT